MRFLSSSLFLLPLTRGEDTICCARFLVFGWAFTYKEFILLNHCYSHACDVSSMLDYTVCSLFCTRFILRVVIVFGLRGLTSARLFMLDDSWGNYAHI